MSIEKVFKYVDSNQARFVQELLPLIAQPSISTTGEGMRECAKMLKESMERVGIITRLLETENFPVVYGEIAPEKSDKTLLLLCHYDVVPPGPLEHWPHPPFTPVIEDNRIWARGSGDAKGQLFASLKAVEAWKAICGEFPVNLRFMFIGDEEIGSPTLTSFIEKHIELVRADAVLFTDASTLDVWGPIVFLANRGVLAIELIAYGAKSSAHSGSYGGLLRNPALRLCQAIASMRDSEGRIQINGFFDDLCPLGAVERELLAHLTIDRNQKLQTLGASEFWGDPGYDYFETQMYRPTFNIHGLTSGYQDEGWMASVPSEAKAKIDINIVPDLDHQDILNKIKRHLLDHGFEDIEVKELARLPYASAANLDDPFLGVVSRAQMRVWGMPPVIYPSIGGAGDLVKAFKEGAGIKQFLMVPLAQPDLNEHSPLESFDLSWYVKGIKTIAAIIDEFAAMTSFS